jgi:hypothetical protein
MKQLLLLWLLIAAGAQMGGSATGDLAKAVQNPVASLISVPVQNFTDFNIRFG